MSGPILVRRRLTPTASRVRMLLEAVSEVEAIDEDALPPAHLSAHALAAIRQDAPSFKADRVTISVKGLAHAHLETRIAGVVARIDGEHARARARVVQRTGPVLEVEAHGHVESPARSTRLHMTPGPLAAFARAVDLTPRHYSKLVAWPTDYVVALCDAGVEAENEGGLARLIRLHVELVHDAPIEKSLQLAIDGVRPVSGDMAKVVFRVTCGGGRLVARGDALIVSALARSCAIAIPLRLVA